jgi:hypothetical protein
MNRQTTQQSTRESNQKRYPVLLLGYSRPEKTLERVREILGSNPSLLMISIDGPRNKRDIKTREDIREQLREFKSNHKVKITYRERNLGLQNHLPKAVDEILEHHDGVIVIEDDVRCSSVFYNEVCDALSRFGAEYMTVGGFSPISIKLPKVYNRWRATKYFSAWGWGITKELWQKYEPTIEPGIYKENLMGSNLWKELNASQKETWMGRFHKVSSGEKTTWDFQMQYSSFKYDLHHLNVLFRVCENVGFADIRGTNTKSDRPTLLGKEFLSEAKFKHKICSKPTQRAMEILDSIVIAGDRKMLHLLANIKHHVKNLITWRDQ